MRRIRALAVVAGVAALATLAGCGGSSADGTESQPPLDISARGTTGEQALEELEKSVELEAAEFLERPESALGVSLREFLGPRIETEVEAGSAICRRGRDTPSIADPRRYPFACVVRGSADGEGLLVEVTLGFVGLSVEGRCWEAVNERVLVTTTRPTTLSRPEAMRPPNRLQGCA